MNKEVSEDEDNVIETKDNLNNNDAKPISMSNGCLTTFVGKFSQFPSQKRFKVSGYRFFLNYWLNGVLTSEYNLSR